MEAVPDNAVIDLYETTNSSIYVTWQKLNVSEDITNHYGYLVRATENGTMHYAVEERVMHQIYDGSFEIGSLRYNTYYILEVTPYRMWGNSTELGTPYTKITQKTRCTSKYWKRCHEQHLLQSRYQKHTGYYQTLE